MHVCFVFMDAVYTYIHTYVNIQIPVGPRLWLVQAAQRFRVLQEASDMWSIYARSEQRDKELERNNSAKRRKTSVGPRHGSPNGERIVDKTSQFLR
jgi:hypothetical protein